jgi:chromosome segregation ATPase
MSARVSLLAALLLSLPASAAIYKWVDENGKVQYSDKPPQQQTKQGTTRLNERGMVLDKSEGYLTPEQRAVKEQELAKQREREQKELDARRRDKALLNSFAKTSEIDTLLNRNLEQVQAGIQSDRSRQEVLQKRLDEFHAKADKLSAAKKPISADLQEKIDTRKAEIAKLQQDIKQKEGEAAQLRERAEQDKKRLIELRGPGAK